MDEWFAGHVVRDITRYSSGGRRRGSKRVTTPDYSSGQPTFAQLQALPCYKIEKNLSGRTCLWLFKSHPNGFLVINDITKRNTEGELFTTTGTGDVLVEKEYYKATEDWVSNLPVYEDVVVPEGEFSTMSNRDVDAYKAMVKQRKLEGKFTAKQLNKTIKCGTWQKNSPKAMFEYNMYEGKFEQMEGKTIIYGFQEDDKDLRKLLAWLIMSLKQQTLWQEDTLLFLKIGQQYTSQFAQLKNAYYIGSVLNLKTPLTALLASFASAFTIKEELAKYHILANFDKISHGMATVYKDLHAKVEDKLWGNSYPDAIKDLQELCKNNLDQSMEDAYKAIKAYFVGAELLMCPNFGVYTDCASDKFARYLGEYVTLNRGFIREFLVERGKHVDTIKEKVLELVEAI